MVSTPGPGVPGANLLMKIKYESLYEELTLHVLEDHCFKH